MIRALIFDFDGVILDSVPIKTRAFSALFSEYGPEAEKRVVEYHLKHGGISRYRKFEWFYREVLGKEATQQELKELGRRFEELALQAVLDAPAIPGALEFLQENFRSYKMFVVSGTPQGEIVDIVRERKLDDFFLGVHGSPDTKADITKKILEQYQLKPEEGIFIGDAMTDHDAAAKCGLFFIGVAPDLKGAFPTGTRIVADLRGLKGALEKIPD